MNYSDLNDAIISGEEINSNSTASTLTSMEQQENASLSSGTNSEKVFFVVVVVVNFRLE